MTKILTKRIYASPSECDGLRILVDRLWPRGVSKKAAALDLWAKEVAPSVALREWFDHRQDRFLEFERRYKQELKLNAKVAELRDFIGPSNATLLFGAKDPAINHAVVLAEALTHFHHADGGRRALVP